MDLATARIKNNQKKENNSGVEMQAGEVPDVEGLTSKEVSSLAASLARVVAQNVNQAGLLSSMGEQLPLYMPRCAAKFVELIDLDSTMYAFHWGSEHGSLVTHKTGEMRKHGNFSLAYLDHHTLTLMLAERYLPPLYALSAVLMSTFDFVTSRLILIPPGVPLSTMVSSGDTLAVQIWGEQTMLINSSEPESQHESKTVTMRPGDALYLPLRAECKPCADPDRTTTLSQTPVLCAAMSLRGPQQSLGSALGACLSDLLLVGNLVPESDLTCRTALLPGHQMSDNSGDATLKKCIVDLIKGLDAPVLRENLAKRMKMLTQEQFDGIVTAALPSHAVMPSSVVRLADGVTCKCKPGENMAFFERGCATLPMLIAPTASRLVHELADGIPHRASSLRCDDPVERLCVCQVLLHKECLSVVRQP